MQNCRAFGETPNHAPARNRARAPNRILVGRLCQTLMPLIFHCALDVERLPVYRTAPNAFGVGRWAFASKLI